MKACLDQPSWSDRIWGSSTGSGDTEDTGLDGWAFGFWMIDPLAKVVAPLMGCDY